MFRKAKNGMQYLQRIKEEIGIPVRILTQDMEAYVGYQSVVSFDKSIKYVWDSGASSFQISTLLPNTTDSDATDSDATDSDSDSDSHSSSDEDEQVALSTYMDAIGASVANRIFIENIRNESLRNYRVNVNPVTEIESTQLVDILRSRLPEPPSWLTECSGATVGAAAVNSSIFKLCCDVLSDIYGNSVTSFTQEEACVALRSCFNRSNDDLMKYASFQYVGSVNAIVIKLSLLVAVMQHTGIQRVHTFPCVGSCPGVISDEQFWNKS